MSESKHTPGPWVWNHGYNGLSGADGYQVLPYADYENMWLPSYDAQGIADGHLIAAAPDLLADALEQADFLDGLADTLDAWAKESRTGGWSTHQVTQNIAQASECRRQASHIRATIRKAEGRS